MCVFMVFVICKATPKQVFYFKQHSICTLKAIKIITIVFVLIDLLILYEISTSIAALLLQAKPNTFFASMRIQTPIMLDIHIFLFPVATCWNKFCFTTCTYDCKVMLVRTIGTCKYWQGNSCICKFIFIV